jgi:hypothetical protein
MEFLGAKFFTVGNSSVCSTPAARAATSSLREEETRSCLFLTQ